MEEAQEAVTAADSSSFQTPDSRQSLWQNWRVGDDVMERASAVGLVGQLERARSSWQSPAFFPGNY